MATIWQQPKCCKCRRRRDVKTNDMTPLPDTWQCGEPDCGEVAAKLKPRDAYGREIALHSAPEVTTITKPSKYHNEETIVDGIKFASKKEAKRYGELKLMEKAGEIRRGSIELQRRFVLNVPIVDGGIQVGEEHVCDYVADFVYIGRVHGGGLVTWAPIVEDAKGVRTPVFKLKKKLMKAVLGIEVQEV